MNSPKRIPKPTVAIPPHLLFHTDYIKQELDYFKTQEWDANNYSNLYSEYLEKLGFVTRNSINLRKGTLLYRCRPNPRQGFSSLDQESNFFNNIKELGINTSEKTVSYGRANAPGSPVLYCCDNAMTAIHEIAQWERESSLTLKELIHKNKGLTAEQINDNIGGWGEHKYVTISIWEVQEDLKLVFFLNKDKMPLSQKMLFERHLSDDNNHPPDSLLYNQVESLKMIRTFFADEFTKKNIKSQSDYMLSALAADMIFKMGRLEVGPKVISTDGILYASVADGYNGYNYAISEAAVKSNKLKFVSAETHLRGNPMTSDFHGVMARAELVSEETGELSWHVFKRNDASESQ